MEVNGKEYPLWGQFVERKAEFIGGILEDLDDDPRCSTPPRTKIVDIKLVPNGEDSAFFSVEGEKYGCGFDVGTGGVSGRHGKPNDGWLYFSGYMGHTWRIRKPEPN